MLYAYIEKTGKKDFQMKIGRVSDPRPHPLHRGPSRLTYAELAVVVAEAGQGGRVGIAEQEQDIAIAGHERESPLRNAEPPGLGAVSPGPGICRLFSRRADPWRRVLVLPARRVSRQKEPQPRPGANGSKVWSRLRTEQGCLRFHRREAHCAPSPLPSRIYPPSPSASALRAPSAP